jgi:hypothetical protein
MNYEHLLGIDPSGSYHEGKGTTGWCIFNCKTNKVTKSSDISAKNYMQDTHYWDAHLKLIAQYNQKYHGSLCIVMEDYILYSSKASDQINSHMETSKLIGIIQYFCYKQKIPCVTQLATEVKNRWTDDILIYNGYIIKPGKYFMLPDGKTKLHDHCRDSIRHAVHFATFKNNKGVN